MPTEPKAGLATVFAAIQEYGGRVDPVEVKLPIQGEEFQLGSVHVKLGPQGVEITVWVESCYTDLIEVLKSRLPSIGVNTFETSGW